MRLVNFEGLCRLAKDDTYPAQMQGALHVCANRGSSKLVPRYGVLKSNLLFIFAKKSDPAPCQLLLVDGYDLDMCEQNSDCVFRLVARTDPTAPSEGFYEFLVPSRNHFRQWVGALLNCSYKELSDSSAIFAYELAEISKVIAADPLVDESTISTRPSSWPTESSTPPDEHGQGFISLLSKLEQELRGRFYKKH